MIPSGVVAVLDEERWMWTRGDVGLEVAMKDGNRAICCSECGGISSGSIGRRAEIPDEVEGDGDGGSCILVVDRALPFDLSHQCKIPA